MSNVAASVYQKLRNLSKDRRIDMPVLLRRYAQERLLYRLSVSSVADEFCVKGGVLLAAYNNGNLLRPTEDIDFNGFEKDRSMDSIIGAIREIVTAPVSDDGVVFDMSSIRIKSERTGVVPGAKIQMSAKVYSANVDVRIDIGLGNVITPQANAIEMPTLLDSVAPRPKVLAYPLETVISEKTHAMVMYGLINNRIKDFYDIWTLIQCHDFELKKLSDAMRNTFKGQERPIPPMPIACLTQEYAEDKAREWKMFIAKIDEKRDIHFSDVISDVSDFLGPVIEAAKHDDASNEVWYAGSGWSSKPAIEHAHSL